MKLFRKFSLTLDRIDNGLAAVFQFLDVGQPLLYGPNLNLIEIVGGFFAIARNKGDCVAFIQKLDDG